MKKVFFLRNLTLFILPLLIPLTILGAFSILITQSFIKNEIVKSNEKILVQTRNTVELLFNDLDSLSLSFSLEPYITLRLKSLLEKQYLDYDALNTLSLIKSITDPPVNSKPFIDSVYVYISNNLNNFFASKNGLSNIETFNDISWFDSFISSSENVNTWIESRNLENYDYENKETKLVSIYRKLYLPGYTKANGVIVVNIKRTYIEKILNNLLGSPDQAVLIIDRNNRIISNSISGINTEDIDITKINSISKTFFEMKLGKKKYAVSQISSERYDLKYVSIVPLNTLYSVPKQLSYLTVVLLISSFLLGSVLAFYITKKNYGNLQNVLSILESAEKGNVLPQIPSRVNNEYGYILQNIIKTFIEQSYLKIQLSEKKYKLKTMEILALQSQINPHFLFNTLKTIFWKTVRLTGGQNDASKMIEHLSEILHYSLGNPDKMVTMTEEIKYTCCYLEIQQIRYNNKFGVIWQYEDNIERIRIIKLILQPLIENSIYHGIKEKEGSSYIKIKIKRVNALLNITIIDNGVGIKPEDLAIIRKKLEEENDYCEHIGLNNINKRLKLFYGDEYGIYIRSKYGLGTVVYVTIPINENRCR